MIRIRCLVLVLTACQNPPETDSLQAPIANGSLASPGQYPWAVFLTLEYQDGSFHGCSGTLIDADTVLTAAHCLKCTDWGFVEFLGDSSSDGVQPGIGVLVDKSHMSVNPAAYLSPVDCSNPLWGIATVADADVAVIDLPYPVAHAPKPVLLTPPYGFSPVQDLYGQDVTIVGRGETSPGAKDAQLMRVGHTPLDAWSFKDSGCTGTDRRFMLKLENPGSEAIVQKGDSGGPMVAEVSGQERVIGVCSTGFQDLYSHHAATFLTHNATFLAPHVNAWASPTDEDGDGIPAFADNCPLDANTDQMDRDGDATGDICDTCTPLPATGLPDVLTRFDGVPAPPGFWDPEQENANQEAEDELLLTSEPQLLDGGEVTRLSYLEYTFALAHDEDEGNCDIPTLVQLRHESRRGDACDPTPVARSEVTFAAIDPSLSPPSFFPCAANGYGFATCSYQVPGGLTVTPTAALPVSGDVGFRFCACDQAHETEAQRRLYCGAATAADCAIDAGRYPPGDPAWRLLHLAGGNGVIDTLVSATFAPGGAFPFAVPWDALADMAALTGIPLPSTTPWSFADGGIVGGPPAVPGILWSHTADPATPAAEHYTAADLEVRQVYHWYLLPQYAPAWPWEYCPVCLDDFPWLHLVNPDPVKPLAVAVGPGGATDVTAKISAVAFPLLSSGKTRVSAAESSSQLDGRGQVFREVLVDSALNVAGRLGVKDGQVVAEEYEAVSAASEPLPRALAYSGALEQLFALVLDPRRGGQLSIWSAPARAWTTRSLVGPRLGTPRALTFRLADQTLYALDQPAGSAWLRLLAIDPGAAVVTVLDARFLPADADAVDVAADLGGGLLVAASADGRTRVDRLVAGGGAWRVGSSATWPAALAGSVRAVERGVLFLVIGDDGLEPVILDFAEFEAP